MSLFVVCLSMVGPLGCIGISSGVFSSGNGETVEMSILFLGVGLGVTYLSSRACIIATSWGVMGECSRGVFPDVLGGQSVLGCNVVYLVMVPVVLCCVFVCVV